MLTVDKEKQQPIPLTLLKPTRLVGYKLLLIFVAVVYIQPVALYAQQLGSAPMSLKEANNRDLAHGKANSQTLLYMVQAGLSILGMAACYIIGSWSKDKNQLQPHKTLTVEDLTRALEPTKKEIATLQELLSDIMDKENLSTILAEYFQPSLDVMDIGSKDLSLNGCLNVNNGSNLPPSSQHIMLSEQYLHQTQRNSKASDANDCSQADSSFNKVLDSSLNSVKEFLEQMRGRPSLHRDISEFTNITEVTDITIDERYRSLSPNRFSSLPVINQSPRSTIPRNITSPNINKATGKTDLWTIPSAHSSEKSRSQDKVSGNE